jgi:hypothetical protein
VYIHLLSDISVNAMAFPAPEERRSIFKVSHCRENWIYNSQGDELVSPSFNAFGLD